MFVSCYGEYKRKRGEMSKHLKDLDRENNELLNIVNKQTPGYIEV